MGLTLQAQQGTGNHASGPAPPASRVLARPAQARVRQLNPATVHRWHMVFPSCRDNEETRKQEKNSGHCRPGALQRLVGTRSRVEGWCTRVCVCACVHICVYVRVCACVCHCAAISSHRCRPRTTRMTTQDKLVLPGPAGAQSPVRSGRRAAGHGGGRGGRVCARRDGHGRAVQGLRGAAPPLQHPRQAGRPRTQVLSLSLSLSSFVSSLSLSLGSLSMASVRPPPVCHLLF